VSRLVILAASVFLGYPAEKQTDTQINGGRKTPSRRLPTLSLTHVAWCVCRGHSADWYLPVFGRLCVSHVLEIRDTLNDVDSTRPGSASA